MILLSLLMGCALASAAPELPRWPPAETTVPGECVQTVGVTQGLPINPLLIGEGSLARCSFIAEPLSSYAHLLAIEIHAKQIRALYEADTAQLRAERDHWHREAKRGTAWYTRPWFVAVTTTALVSGTIASYSLIDGG